MSLPKPTIDRLPEAKRQMVVDALLQGKSLREVAAMVGISFQQVALYKNKHLLPAMQVAVRSVRESGDDVRGSSGFSQAVEMTKSLTRASPFMTRLQKLWERTDNALDCAENAVRVVKDKDGNDVIIGPDLSPIAPLLNQAHKNLELLGRVTGELEAQNAAKIAIQIVLPTGAGAEVSADGRVEIQPTIEAQTPTTNIGITKR